MFDDPASFWPRLQRAQDPNSGPFLPSRRNGGTRDLMRRLADIMVASAILMVTFPLLMLVALAIKYESCGPAFKRTERIAADRRFTLLAFRTTGYDPEFVAPEWSRRTTRLGQFLRYTRIEILPQFINVFRGDQPLRAEWPPEFFRIEHLPQRIARPATTLVYPLVRLTDA